MQSRRDVFATDERSALLTSLNSVIVLRMQNTIRASCLCGQVHWEVDGRIEQPSPIGPDPFAILFMPHCHCSRCRKLHGSPFATYLTVPEDRLHMSHGETLVARVESSLGTWRHFCSSCGSVVPDGFPFHGRVFLPAGSFDDDPGVRPTAHIFVGSKALWVDLEGTALPQFDAYPEGLTPPDLPSRPAIDSDTGEPRGSCLCGSVTYVISAPALRCLTCHCSRCRKAGAAAHMSYLATSLDGVRFTRGEELLRTYKVPQAETFESRFCERCSSPMPRRIPKRGIALVPMGTLDDDPGVRPFAHIHVGSRAPWESIEDKVPQYEGPAPV
jgi:hypothetical protein